MPRTATGSGTRLWVKRYNGPHGFAQATSVAANHRGTTVFVTGFSLGAGSEDYATIAYNATTGAQRWAKRYNDPGNGTDQAYAVAVNPNGSTVFVTGYSVENTSRYTTIAYNATTGAQLWVKQYNSGGQAHSVAVSPNGSTVFVTGFSIGATSGPDYATVAYNATTGAQLWVRKYDGPGNGIDQAQSVKVSPTGKEVFVTGFSAGARFYDYATVAYRASTGARLWLKRYDDPLGGAQAQSVAVSPNGKTVYVTGGTGGHYATVAYNATTGAQRWLKKYNGGGSAYSVAVSPTGARVFVTGYSENRTTFIDDYTTIAYNATTGAQLWLKKYNGPGNGALAYSVAVSPKGATVYVTGASNGSKTTTYYDYATVAYSATTGAQRWVRRYDGPAHGDPVTNPVVITVSPTTGTVFVTGTNHGNYATVAYRG